MFGSSGGGWAAPTNYDIIDIAFVTCILCVLCISTPPAGSELTTVNIFRQRSLFKYNSYFCLLVLILLTQPINTKEMDAKALSSAVAEFSAKFCNVSINYTKWQKRH